MTVRTLEERKSARITALREGVARLRLGLAAYARDHGGRYLLYGSAARDALHIHSDVDLLLDFPEYEQAAAWRFAEDECWRLGLEPDIRPLDWCKPEFVEQALRGAVELR